MQADPIGDLVMRVRNASRARLASVDVSHSRMKVELVKVLEAEGLIMGHEIVPEAKFPILRLHLKQSAPAIRKVSRPGVRASRPWGQPGVGKANTTRILVTGQGYMTEREADRRGIGGEVVCEIY